LAIKANKYPNTFPIIELKTAIHIPFELNLEVFVYLLSLKLHLTAR